MESPRTSVRAIVEWIAAAGILSGVIAGGSLAVREFRTVTAVMPVIAREAVAQVPTAAVPERAVSVPVLLLSEDIEVRVGDAATAVLAKLSRARQRMPASAERGPNGIRETHLLELAGTRFVLVVEPFAEDPEPRVAAIYLN